LTERYKKIYPHINFPPSEDVFDLTIDVDTINPEEIIATIMQNI
jgi:hypothetical protein